MNKKIFIWGIVVLVALGVGTFFYYQTRSDEPVVTVVPNNTSITYIDAEDIVANNPLQPFDVQVSQGKLNINLVCEQATSSMKFADAKSKNTFITDCVDGKYPEVIEKYKADMNLGDGAKI